ncbi:MAG: phytanoyl-CoA dioxygenase family protein [Crocinitomicaceae bacterium]|nr:phytanoyl-CoA dioxygenase family protein [Flavobacteriales bacterium]NQZ34589.1 phytanoyl-CoA dioxygenase family protein [Crocinitomicaceae bacterium]
METENWIDVFHSADLNKTLREDGIVKISLADFKASNYRSFLETTVDGFPKEFEAAFYGSVSIAELDVKRKVHAGIREMLSPTIESLLINHKLLTYFFLVKGIGKNSILKLHQDWSIIDERKHRAYNLWIPLCDSTKKNGTLYAAKGTHRIPLNIRGAGIPPKYANHFKTAEKYLEAIEVKAGEALIFDSRLLHYSPSNTSDTSRSTIINNIIPNSAETMCFHGSEVDGQFTVNRYDVPNDLFIHYDHFNEQKDDPNPSGKFIEAINYGKTETVELSEFVSLLKATSSKKKRWFF